VNPARKVPYNSGKSMIVQYFLWVLAKSHNCIISAFPENYNTKNIIYDKIEKNIFFWIFYENH